MTLCNLDKRQAKALVQRRYTPRALRILAEHAQSIRRERDNEATLDDLRQAYGLTVTQMSVVMSDFGAWRMTEVGPEIGPSDSGDVNP